MLASPTLSPFGMCFNSASLQAHSNGPIPPGELGIKNERFACATAAQGPPQSVRKPNNSPADKYRSPSHIHPPKLTTTSHNVPGTTIFRMQSSASTIQCSTFASFSFFVRANSRLIGGSRVRAPNTSTSTPVNDLSL